MYRLDRRFLSEHFAQRAAEVMAGNGFRVALFQEAVADAANLMGSQRSAVPSGGIVITASHNPPDFNGFKIKAPWGGSAAPETTAAVEKLLMLTAQNAAPFTSDSRRTT